MSRRKVLDRERKAREKKKAENKRGIPNGILFFLVICLALGGLIYTEEDPLIGIAVFLSAGVLVVPNAILMIRDHQHMSNAILTGTISILFVRNL